MNKPNFLINNYTITVEGEAKKLNIEGEKLKPPSKRITLYQKNIKIQEAKIIYKHKKGDIEIEIVRINPVKSFGEIRLHTNSILYPGNYVLSINFIGELNEESLKMAES